MKQELLFRKTQENTLLSDGLVANWKLDGNVFDSANSHDLINEGAINSSVISGSYYFDGSEGTRMIVPSHGDFIIREVDEFSVSTWLKPEIIMNKANRALNNYHVLSNAYGWQLVVQQTGEIGFYIKDGTYSNNNWINSNKTITANEVVHVVVTISAAYNTHYRDIKLFINGSFDNEFIGHPYCENPIINERDWYFADTPFSYDFQGWISDTRYYKKVLTESEAELLYTL